MKKTTKMAAVLAAMSVMAIGAASTAMAANEGWNGNDDDGWTYVQDGVKVKGWQQINGVWYYFQKDGKMAQDELVTISGQTYYLSQTGVMGTGWQRFTSDHDVYEDLEDDFPNNDENKDTVIDDEYLYDDEIWLYFDEHGVAAEDKWVKSDAGLWYYFENLIMARSDYSYEIDDNYYGLDENGAMMVGWVRNNEDNTSKRPTGEDNTKAWYYYQSNGKQVVVDNGEEGKWKKIDGTWYYFVSHDDPMTNNSILTKTYAEIGENYFYLNGDGKMATGVTKVAEDTKISGSGLAVKGDEVDKDIDVYFNSSSGKVETGIKGNSYYIKSAEDTNTLAFEKKGTIASGQVFKGQVKGQLAKEALFVDDGNIYYADKYGEIIKNESLEITFKETGNTYKIVFDSKGKAIKDKDAGDKVKAGKTYTVDEEEKIKILDVDINVFK